MVSISSLSTFSFPKNIHVENQDCLLYPAKMKDGYIFAVADGVGGYKGGKKAADCAIDFLSKHQKNFEIEDIDLIFSQIRNEISALSSEDKSLFSAATTLSFVKISQSNLTIGHCGDCRVYIKNKNKLVQITKDHTQHQVLIDKKLYTASQLKKMDGGNMLTTAISRKLHLEIQSLSIPLKKVADTDGTVTVFIMSDGAHYHWEKRPTFSVNTISNPNRFASSLQKRIERNGVHDDYSLIAVKFTI